MTTTTTENGNALPIVVVADLRARREALGIPRDKIAQLAGCSITHLAQIERGCVPRRGYVLPRILETLDQLEAA